jgi:hypothetical protein
MKHVRQEMRFCKPCRKTTLFQGNKAKINWLMHIALMFVMVGFITLPLAILNRVMNARVGGKHGLFCSACGTEV